MLSYEDFNGVIKDEYGLSTFVYACKNGWPEMVQAMLDYPQSIKLNIKDSMGKTQFLDGFLKESMYLVLILLLCCFIIKSAKILTGNFSCSKIIRIFEANGTSNK